MGKRVNFSLGNTSVLLFKKKSLKVRYLPLVHIAHSNVFSVALHAIVNYKCWRCQVALLKKMHLNRNMPKLATLVVPIHNLVRLTLALPLLLIVQNAKLIFHHWILISHQMQQILQVGVYQDLCSRYQRY